jgi:hypothetical protein
MKPKRAAKNTNGADISKPLAPISLPTRCCATRSPARGGEKRGTGDLVERDAGHRQPVGVRSSISFFRGRLGNDIRDGFCAATGTTPVPATIGSSPTIRWGDLLIG